MRRNDHQIFMNPPGLNSPASCNRADCIGNGESLAPVCVCISRVEGEAFSDRGCILESSIPFNEPVIFLSVGYKVLWRGFGRVLARLYLVVVGARNGEVSTFVLITWLREDA